MEDPTIAFEHPILSIETFPVETRVGTRRYVRIRCQDWVNVVAVTEGGDLVLVRQHRWGIEASTLEIPGGAIDPGEVPEQAARRELIEETGYGGGRWRPLGSVHPNPAIQTNRTWLFVAEGVERVAEPSPEPGESIEIERVPHAELSRLLADGEIDHALAVVSLQRYLLDRVTCRSEISDGTGNRS